VRHEEVGLRYVYEPTRPRREVRKSALRHLVDTFYEGSTEKVVAALLGGEGRTLSDAQVDRIREMVEQARTERKSERKTERKVEKERKKEGTERRKP
jgi:predicted transcriptional regulator